MKPNSAILYSASAAIIWGATAPIMKLTLLEIPVFSLAFLRMVIASLILGLLIYKRLKIQKKDYLNFFFAAITGVTINLTLFFIGLKLTQAILASFLIAATPIFTMLAAHIYLKEKFTTRLIISSLIAFLGVAVIIGKFTSTSNTLEFIGNMLLLGATISWVINEIISKKLLKIYDGSVIAFYTMAIGALTFLPLFLLEFIKTPSWPSHVTSGGFLGLVYGIFFSSLIAYLAWNKGLKQLPAGQAAFFFYLDPISGAIFSMLLLGEKLTPNLLFGGLLILIAIVLAEQHRKSHPLIRN